MPDIASGLIVLLIGMTSYGFYTTHGGYDETKELLDKLLPAVIGLLGFAIGFYFGTRATSRKLSRENDPVIRASLQSDLNTLEKKQ